jgi:hypothetical protein
MKIASGWFQHLQRQNEPWACTIGGGILGYNFLEPLLLMVL